MVGGAGRPRSVNSSFDSGRGNSGQYIHGQLPQQQVRPSDMLIVSTESCLHILIDLYSVQSLGNTFHSRYRFHVQIVFNIDFKLHTLEYIHHMDLLNCL